MILNIIYEEMKLNFKNSLSILFTSSKYEDKSRLTFATQFVNIVVVDALMYISREQKSQ